MPENYVNITESIKSALADFFSNRHYSKITILVDENTSRYCLPIIESSVPTFNVIEIPSGELNKNIDTCVDIWSGMTELGMDRKSLLINLGGGVIGDMGGFCASTFKRGIHFINIPTTLLSQVDASVGGKLGIDFQGFKNHIGLFCNPEAVLADPTFLRTLPEREIRSGFAEIIKHALIRDKEYLTVLMQYDIKTQPWLNHIRHSVKIKSDVVTADPKESGLRKILNFGHTMGHAIETHFLEKTGPLLHGEAIAIGMICETFLSTKLLKMSKEEMVRIQDYLIGIFGKVSIEKEEFEAILENMTHDKKNDNGLVKMSLLNSIGNSTYDINVSKADALDSLFHYQKI
jgi:3-dehydroquinate synthase